MFDCHLMLLPVPESVESVERAAEVAAQPEVECDERPDGYSWIWDVPGLLERVPVKVPAT